MNSLADSDFVNVRLRPTTSSYLSNPILTLTNDRSTPSPNPAATATSLAPNPTSANASPFFSPKRIPIIAGIMLPRCGLRRRCLLRFLIRRGVLGVWSRGRCIRLLSIRRLRVHRRGRVWNLGRWCFGRIKTLNRIDVAVKVRTQRSFSLIKKPAFFEFVKVNPSRMIISSIPSYNPSQPPSSREAKATDSAAPGSHVSYPPHGTRLCLHRSQASKSCVS